MEPSTGLAFAHSDMALRYRQYRAPSKRYAGLEAMLGWEKVKNKLPLVCGWENTQESEIERYHRGGPVREALDRVSDTLPQSHTPGSRIFFIRQNEHAFSWKDCVTYWGQWPRDYDDYLRRLQRVLPGLVEMIVSILLFNPDRDLGWPNEIANLVDNARGQRFSDKDVRKLVGIWKTKFKEPDSTGKEHYAPPLHIPTGRDNSSKVQGCRLAPRQVEDTRTEILQT